MTLNEFIEDAFNKEHEFLMDALSDLTPEEAAWRPGPEANPIVWILWHMLRVEDMWFQFFIQRNSEIWERDGWNEKFGLPTRDNGFGHTAEQVASFPALDIRELVSYGDAVRDRDSGIPARRDRPKTWPWRPGQRARRCRWPPSSARSSARSISIRAISPTSRACNAPGDSV